MGSPAFAVPSLTALAERPDLCNVVAAVTQPDKPAGRGRKLTACAVKIAAQARGIPVLEPVKMRAPETQQALAAFEPDLCGRRLWPHPAAGLAQSAAPGLH
ncbi:MAG: hypothetical protein R3C68_04265 [Myxococcota bacterium]